jgi:hypothetical protein
MGPQDFPHYKDALLHFAIDKIKLTWYLWIVLLRKTMYRIAAQDVNKSKKFDVLKKRVFIDNMLANWRLLHV